MAAPDLVMYEEEYQQIKDILQRLQVDSNSKICFLVDKNGQQIAVHGDMRGVDATSLASLTAGNVAATDGLAKLIGEKEFSILFHEGEKDKKHHWKTLWQVLCDKQLYLQALVFASNSVPNYGLKFTMPQVSLSLHHIEPLF